MSSLYSRCVRTCRDLHVSNQPWNSNIWLCWYPSRTYIFGAAVWLHPPIIHLPGFVAIFPKLGFTQSIWKGYLHIMYMYCTCIFEGPVYMCTIFLPQLLWLPPPPTPQRRRLSAFARSLQHRNIKMICSHECYLLQSPSISYFFKEVANFFCGFISGKVFPL